MTSHRETLRTQPTTTIQISKSNKPEDKNTTEKGGRGENGIQSGQNNKKKKKNYN